MIKHIALMMFAVGALSASAGELDPTAPADGKDAPQGLVVREDVSGHQEIYLAKDMKVVTDEKAAMNAMSHVKKENLMNVTDGTELDKVTSDESWHRWSYSGGYNYGNYYRNSCGNYYSYNYYRGSYGYTYYYYPSYSYRYSGYSYTYYYPRYSNCYRGWW
ncbi:MAG: hypothetical protein AB7F66_10215 [Bacteriovoracia bacterium]